MENYQNKKSHFSSKAIIGSVVAAVCIIIYMCALVQASVRLYLSIERNRQTAEHEFSQIADIALTAGMQGFMDQRFIEIMNNALAASTSIEAFIISGPDSDYAFEKQSGHAVVWVNNSPRFINRISFSNQSYYRSLPIQNVRNSNIKATASAFNYNELNKILKETLLIILIGFAISFFTMLMQLLLGKQGETGQLSSRSTERFNDPPIDETDYSNRIHSDNSYSDNRQRYNDSTQPKGLYSPRSSIGWEEYTKDRLDSELHRCSSTEKDLALGIIEFTDLTNDAMFRQSAAEAISFFSERDLLFEYGNWGISVMLPGISLENAITKSEKFYQHIMGKFPRGYNRSSSIFIGLTSRSGRLLNADRLMLEAEEALKKAKKDPKTPIIAFKSDPEKYREFIRAKN